MENIYDWEKEMDGQCVNRKWHNQALWWHEPSFTHYFCQKCLQDAIIKVLLSQPRWKRRHLGLQEFLQQWGKKRYPQGKLRDNIDGCADQRSHWTSEEIYNYRAPTGHYGTCMANLLLNGPQIFIHVSIWLKFISRNRYGESTIVSANIRDK